LSALWAARMKVKAHRSCLEAHAATVGTSPSSSLDYIPHA
jgi:hypothetical protein